jgi:hypothetical protein
MHYYDHERTYASKIEALKNSTNIKFYYYDHMYDLVDWTKEPLHNLDYYYLEQAKRIRDKYDYVILCYSGGFDSTNILETFYYNNIKLDKIVIVGAFDQDSKQGVDENHNGELYHTAFPYLKELNLDTITQVCDYSKLFSDLNNFSVCSYQEDWVDHVGGWFSPHHWFWRDIEKYVIPTEWRNKSVALVFGKDKPGLFPHPITHQFTTFWFRDVAINAYGNSKGFDNCDRINFYWDPTYPEILVKQLHMLKKVQEIKNEFRYDAYHGVNRYGDLNVNQIVYNLKRPILYKSPKSPSNILSLRDAYLKHKQNSDVYELYSKGLSKIQSIIDVNKIPSIKSKLYSLI